MPVRAQLKEPVPPVTLSMKNVPLGSVLKELEKQTGMFFSYESSLLAHLPKVSIQLEEVSFTFCLNRLFENLPLTYRITGQYVILKTKPRQYTISGFVRDSVSYESFIYATVLDKISGKGVTTNNYGFFSLTLPAGPVSLQCSYVGFTGREWTFELFKDTLVDLQLSPLAALGEIVISAVNPFSGVMNSRMGTLDLTFQQMKNAPGFLSEDDPVKAIHRTPDISFGTEGLTGVYVRGGTGDDNLFLVDGIPLYSIHHLGGLISTFNPDVIKNIDFYKGGFPARYGGRLSSVMDVRLKEGDKQSWHGNLSIGLISAKAQIEGPIVRDRTTFNMAFRRTWLDAITAPAFAITNKKEEGEMFAGYSFYDWNVKITHYFEDRSRLNIHFYMGQDRLRLKDWDKYYSQKTGSDFKWRWGNLVTSANWNKAFHAKLYGTFQMAYTRYTSKMDQSEINTPYFYYSVENKPFTFYSMDESHYSGIEDITSRVEFDYSPHPDHLIRFGSDHLYHLYKPEYRSFTYGTKEEEEWKLNQYDYVDQNVYAYEWSLYAEDDWSVNKRWKVNIGGRLDGYHVEGESYISFQPRFSLRYLLTRDMSLKTSYAQMNRYAHKLSGTMFNLPSDIWVPVTADVKPMHSHLISAGWYYSPAQAWDMSVEGYFKKMNHLIDYKDYAMLFPQYTGWDKKNIRRFRLFLWGGIYVAQNNGKNHRVDGLHFILDRSFIPRRERELRIAISR